MDPISPNSMNTIPIPSKKNKTKLWLIISIIAALIVIAFGIYFWQGANISNTESTTEQLNEINSLKTQSSSDNLSAIEKDLQATNLDSLDAEAPLIEAQLSAPATK